VTVPLPLVPPAFEHELLGSWMQRTASVYDCSAHQLLDGWMGPCPRARWTPSVEMRVVEGRATTLVAHHMRASSSSVTSMLPDHPGWLVACDDDVAVCSRCLLDDDAAASPRFRRRDWAECWRVRCVRHRAILVDMPDWSSCRLAAQDGGRALMRNASGKIVGVGRNSTNRLNEGASVRVGVALKAIAQMETAIGGALAGRRPHAPSWGDIDADGFLQVVRDVTTFLLSGFSSIDPKPFCGKDLYRYRDDAAVRCFERRRPRCMGSEQGETSTLASLAQVGSVGWRRSALFWACQLMHARTAQPWLPGPLKRDRQLRQSTALKRQTSAGMDWLADRMMRWPERYRSQRWRD
jgi:hypothetical protein